MNIITIDQWRISSPFIPFLISLSYCTETKFFEMFSHHVVDKATSLCKLIFRAAKFRLGSGYFTFRLFVAKGKI